MRTFAARVPNDILWFGKSPPSFAGDTGPDDRSIFSGDRSLVGLLREYVGVLGLTLDWRTARFTRFVVILLSYPICHVQLFHIWSGDFGITLTRRFDLFFFFFFWGKHYNLLDSMQIQKVFGYGFVVSLLHINFWSLESRRPNLRIDFFLFFPFTFENLYDIDRDGEIEVAKGKASAKSVVSYRIRSDTRVLILCQKKKKPPPQKTKNQKKNSPKKKKKTQPKHLL